MSNPPAPKRGRIRMHETDSEEDLKTENSKKTKSSHKWDQKYKIEWEEKYNTIRSSSKGLFHAFCTACNQHISVRFGGVDNIKKHCETEKHRLNVISSQSKRTLTSMMPKVENLSVIRAETLFTKWLVDHNIPLAAADGFGEMLRKMVPDSEIAKKYSCGRTKASAIASVLSRETAGEVACFMNSFTFSLATDGSNDNCNKLYPVVVTIFDSNMQKIQTRILSVPELHEASTGTNIAALFLSQLKENSVDLSNLLAFVSDNASVMVGCHNGVVTKLKERQPQLLEVRCACHLINLAAKKAFGVLPLHIDELLLDIYYFLEPSDKRLRDFKDQQLLYSDEVKKILKYCSTRWLSLSKCITSLIELYSPLKDVIDKVYREEKEKQLNKKQPSSSKKDEVATTSDAGAAVIDSWFKSQVQPPPGTSKETSAAAQVSGRLKRIRDALQSRRTYVYCLFLQWIMLYFDKSNQALQHDKPLIHKMYDILLSLYKDLLCLIIKPAYLHCRDLLKIDLRNSALHISLDDMYFGEQTANALGKLNSQSRKEFKLIAKEFILTAVEYMKRKFPFQDPLLKHAAVADVTKRISVEFSALTYFTDRMAGFSKDVLHKEFHRYQTRELTDEVLKMTRADDQWVYFKNLKDPTLDELLFANLAKAMLGILTIPHSNANAERAFSMVRKNRTSQRSSLSGKSVESVLVTKFGHPNLEFSNALLKKCKSATSQALQT